MFPSSYQKLIEGYRQFRVEYLDKQYGAYRSWASKQQIPRVMMIACSDSRVNPAILTHAGLGDIFMVNNVANIVPPYKAARDTHHSTSAALEYAVHHLKIEHIIILGHSGCGGIKALMQGTVAPNDGSYSFIGPWVEIAAAAKEKVLQTYPDLAPEELESYCERQALICSLKNLTTFPWISDALTDGTLSIHAWYFNIDNGEVIQFDEASGDFIPLVADDYESK